MQINSNSDSPKQVSHSFQEIDYVRLLRIFLSRWYWVVGTVILGIIIAYVNLRFTPSTYQSSALLKFDDKKTEISELININSYYDRKDKIQSEIYVIQSRTLLSQAVNRLNYPYSFYRIGTVLESETYPNKPCDVEILKIDSNSIFSYNFIYKQKDKLKFSLSIYANNALVSEADYFFGQEVNIAANKFRIIKSLLPDADQSNYRLIFNHPSSLLGRMMGGLQVREVGKGVNIMALTFTDRNPVIAADMLNAIVAEYRIYDKDQKGLAAAQTIEFVDEQMAKLSEKVKYSEQVLEEYKVGKSILNIEDNKNIAYQKLRDLEVQKNLINIQSIAIDLLEEQIKNNKETLTLNFTLDGTEDKLMSELVNQMNTMFNERIKKQSLYADNAAPIQEIDRQIEEAKKAITLNIKASRDRNNRTIKFIEKQLATAKEELKLIPSAERDLINLERDFEINQKVYSYLQEKRLEASIAKSAIMPSSNVIDPAIPNYGAIAPNRNSVYLTSFIISFLVGIGFILLARLLNQKVFDKETVEMITSVPIIGVIRNFPGTIDKNSSQILSLSNPKSMFSESVRSVRTNLSFIASDIASKMICVTSEVSGEGKSFTVINLASTLSLINKKVVVIDGDLRKSKLHHTFRLKNDWGLTSYLSNQCDVDKIIHQTNVENLSFIPAGPMPPNPSELLYSERMRQLIKELKARFDYVLVDTAPIGLVSDAIPLVRTSDINIFVLRSGVSTFNAASIPERVSKEFGLNNSVIVLNGFSNDPLHSRIYSNNKKGSYGSGQYYYTDYSTYGNKSYGYYTDGSDDSFINKVYNKFRNLFSK
jgi:capsular exopolysaccharide synthesis family protein